MKKKLFFLILFTAILSFNLFFIRINFVLAQCIDAINCSEYCNDPCSGGVGYNPPSGALCLCPPTSATNVENVLENITNYIFFFATIITPILIIIGAFTFMTSGGEYEKVNTAKRIITYTIIGYTIILFSRGLVYILRNILGQ